MHRLTDISSRKKISYLSLINSDISHEEHTLVINEEQSCCRLKENIRVKDNLLDNIERDSLIKQVKRIGQNKKQTSKVKIEVWNLLKLWEGVITLFEVQK